MKKLVILSFVLLGSLTTFAQSSIVKLHPVPLANRTFSIGFEQKVKASSAIQANVDYATESSFGFTSTWFGIGAEYRIYDLVPALKIPGTSAPTGFFVAPTIGMRFFKDVDKDDPDPAFDEKYSFLNLGALAGYQYLPKFKTGKTPLALEASFGLLAGLMTNGEKEDYEDYQLWPRFEVGIVPTFNISVGFAFGK